MVRVKVVAVILSAFFILSEAAVTLEVISGLSKDKTIECGQSDVIRCVVSPFPGSVGYMAWNTDLKSLTQCFGDSDNDCTSLSVDHYQFSSKLSDETFNLTFNTVKLSDSSVEFRCTDTITTASVTPNVAVFPDNASTTNSSSGLELEVTTGCVYPVSAVTFKWYYMDSGSSIVLESTKSVKTEDSTDCNIDSIGDCGGSDVKKLTSKLTTDSEGEEHNIYVDVIHDDVPENDPNYVVSKSFGMFKVKKATIAAATIASDGLPLWKIFLIVIGCVTAVLFLAGLILGCCFLKSVNKKNCPCCKCCFIEGLPTWYRILWFTVIGTPVALGMFCVLKCCKQDVEFTGLGQTIQEASYENGGHCIKCEDKYAIEMSKTKKRAPDSRRTLLPIRDGVEKRKLLKKHHDSTQSNDTNSDEVDSNE